MPFPPITDPVPSTVITSAWEIANPLAAVRWLRQLMGNSDPPGSNYVVVSSSTSSGGWSKVTADVMNAGAVVGNLGYTPVNKAGDTGIGALTSTATVTAERLVAGVTGVSSGGPVTGTTVAPSVAYGGGTTTAGGISVLGLNVGGNGVAIAGAGGLSVTGGPIQGGTTTAGTPSVLGLNVGNSGVGIVGTGGLALTGGGGIASGGVTVLDGVRHLTPASYGGGSASLGNPSMRGLNVGDLGMAIAGQLNSSVAHPTPPMIASSQGKVVNLHADILDGSHASTTPSGGAIPIADAGGKLDAWVTPSGAAGIPAGVGGFWDGVIATIPAGWTRTTGLIGRVPVGAGTTFGQTFVEGGSYGTSWSHAHTSPSHAHSGASLSVSGSTGTPSSTGTGGGTGASFADGSHTHNQGTLDVGGNTDGFIATVDPSSHMIAMFGVVWITKT